MELSFRSARSDDAETLSDLALRSKGHWPYDADFIRDCKAELTLNPEYTGSGLVQVGEIRGEIVGFYGFSPDLEKPEMGYLFVEPSFIGKGVGIALWKNSLSFAKARSWPSFLICADPYAAEGFYSRVGCIRIGEVKSPVRPGRVLPLFRYDLLDTNR